MNHVTAFLAFAAIMIVLTTLATVVVEGIHKFLNQRSADFAAMLTQLYENSVKPRLIAEFKKADKKVEECAASTLTAEDFVDQLVSNPAFAKKRQALARPNSVTQGPFQHSVRAAYGAPIRRTIVSNEGRKRSRQTGRLYGEDRYCQSCL